MVNTESFWKVDIVKQHRLWILLLLAAVTSACHADELPDGVTDTQNSADVSLSPEESLARIVVPDGFQVSLFAAEPDIRRPIAFDFDDRGRLWVVENYSHPDWKEGEGRDRVIILEDVDNDGQFDRRKVFWDRGRYLTGIAVGHGGVWLANTPELSFIPDRNGDDIPDSGPIAKLDGFQISNNNVVNNLHWGPDGWLYGAIGLPSKSQVGPPNSQAEARVAMTRGMWRYHPYRSDSFEVLASGMVNPWGADFNEYGDLITSNTVIAHLWHIVPGMYCERRTFEKDNPFVYERIQSIADHLHWGGGNWQSSRSTDEHHHVAGGGHAHCGGMVYLGDNWPDEFRGTFITGNLHGNRLNNDALIPSRSSYVGVHREDFFFAKDPWFRSMSQKYGPDGGVYISDWHDFGECHDKDGSHRSSGRIYKLTHRPTRGKQFNLASLSAVELAELHTHRNEWMVRHSRRLLQERSYAANNTEELLNAAKILKQQFIAGETTVDRLRAMWTLHTMRALPPERLIEAARDRDPHVRRWTVTLLTDEALDEAIAGDVYQQAAGDSDARVRLAVASAMRKLPAKVRWAVAGVLSQFSDDASDPYLPLMIWYAVEPLVVNDSDMALQFARKAKLPRLKQFVIRRLTEDTRRTSLSSLFEFVGNADVTDRVPLLTGIAKGLESSPRRNVSLRNVNFAPLLDQANSEILPLLTRISISLGDQKAIDSLKAQVLDAQTPIAERRRSLSTVLQLADSVEAEFLHRVIASSSELRLEAIEGLAARSTAATAGVLLPMLEELNRREQVEAIGVLTARADTAKELLRFLRTNPNYTDAVSAYSLQRLRDHVDPEIGAAVKEIWKSDVEAMQKSRQLEHYRKLLTPEFLAAGNPTAGRRLFEATCAKCHRLFGEGNDLGPELTGSGRANLDYVLQNLVDPSGLVDAAYRMTTIVTDEGRVLTGLIVKHDDYSVQLKTQNGTVSLNLKNVESLTTSGKSMMPDGLLRTYSDEEIRDLVRYLASPIQVPLFDR